MKRNKKVLHKVNYLIFFIFISISTLLFLTNYSFAQLNFLADGTQVSSIQMGSINQYQTIGNFGQQYPIISGLGQYPTSMGNYGQFSAGIGILGQYPASMGNYSQYSTGMGNISQFSTGIGILGQYPASMGNYGQYSTGMGNISQFSAGIGILGQYPAGMGNYSQYSTSMGNYGQFSTSIGVLNQYPIGMGNISQYPAGIGVLGQYPVSIGSIGQYPVGGGSTSISPEKELVIKYYEIQKALGYSASEKSDMRSELKQEKVAVLRDRLANRIEELDPSNHLSSIIVPLMFRQIEKESKCTTNNLSNSVRSALSNMITAYNSLPASVKVTFDSRYVNTDHKISKLQLGKDILRKIRPDYQQEINSAIYDAFNSGLSKIDWGSNTLRNRNSQGYIVNDGVWNNLHTSLAGLYQFQPDEVPDINSEHHVRDYYRYQVYLDWFRCITQNERTCLSLPIIGNVLCSDDEPYWNISSLEPRFDPQDPSNMHLLHTGDLYEIRNRVTGTYEDIQEGNTKRFRSSDRRVLYGSSTFCTPTTFTIGLWEEDWSKDITRQGITDALEIVKDQLIQEIKEAVFMAIKDACMDALISEFSEYTQVVTAIEEFFDGNLSFETLMGVVDQAVGGIDLAWLGIELIFSGKSITEIIEGLGGACWECTVALMAIKVAGPILWDVVAGDFREALRGLLELPYAIMETIVEFFTDIEEFFTTVMGIIDPDDFIESYTVRIEQSGSSIWNDADWANEGFTTFYPYPLSIKYNHGNPSYTGPNESNSSFIKDGYPGYYWQPVLRFEGDDADYKVYYNVKRILAGGRETFGYTLTQSNRSQIRYYTAKTNVQIKISISCLNSVGEWNNPYVEVNNSLRRVAWSNSESNEGTIQGYNGDEYEIVISIPTGDYYGNYYGYITLEEFD